MREKIARIVQVGKIEGRRCDSIADQILSLPVEGFDCTLGELPERARKMKGVLEEILLHTGQIYKIL